MTASIATPSAAREAELDFTVADIDAISRRVPCLSKVAPSSQFHMEDVHRAGGIPAILGELDRGGLLHRDVVTVHSPSVEQWLGERPRRPGEGRRIGRRRRLPARVFEVANAAHGNAA